MRNRTSYGVFITLVLATAFCLGIATAARAELRTGFHPATTTLSRNAPKPAPGPMNGEPDTGQAGPAPPKTGTYPTGVPVSSWWTRAQMLMWTWQHLGHKAIP